MVLEHLGAAVRGEGVPANHGGGVPRHRPWDPRRSDFARTGAACVLPQGKHCSTVSCIVETELGEYAHGVQAQANHGMREELGPPYGLDGSSGITGVLYSVQVHASLWERRGRTVWPPLPGWSRLSH